MSNYLDLDGFVKSINSINAKLVTANFLLRDPAIIDDSIYDSLRCEHAAKTIDEALKKLDFIYMDCYRAIRDRRRAS